MNNELGIVLNALISDKFDTKIHFLFAVVLVLRGVG